MFGFRMAALSALVLAPVLLAAASAEPIETVVVTAEKRSETVQSIPAGISAISGDELKARGIDTVNALQFAVPSLHTGTLTGSTGLTIRGVGATTVGTSGTAGVAVNVDGVYQPQTSTVDLAQMDLERVEVLRGPQGTLYGRNATGGAVNFITKAPTDVLSLDLLAGYATYDEYHLQGILNAPLLDDRVRTRLVIDYDDRESGFVKNIVPGGEDLAKGKDLSGRFRLSTNLTDKLTFDLGVSAFHSTGPWQYLTNYGPPAPLALIINPFLSGATFVGTPRKTNDNDPVDGTRDYQSVSGTFTWELPFATLKSISAYQNYQYNYANDGDGTNLSVAPYTGKNWNRTFTQEFDLSGQTDRFDWVAGAFYLTEQDFNRLGYVFSLGLSGLPPSSYLDFEEPGYGTNSYAGFADATFHVTDALKLIGGVRYSEDYQTATYGNFFGLVVAGNKIPVAPFCPFETDKIKSSSFTPRVGIQYNITPSMMVYFTYSKGYKAGGANIYSCEDDYTPEKLTSYEVGYKSQWFDNTLTFNASAFHYDYSDFQVSQIVGLSLNVTNAAGAQVDGLELEGAWAADENWSLNANFSYINAYYTDFSNTDGLNPAAGLQDLNGNLLNDSPRVSVNAGIVYSSDPLAWGHITAMADASYRSRTYFREFNAIQDSQEPYGLLNLNINWDSPDGKYSGRIYANNLLNESYVQAMGDSTSIGTRYVTWGSPQQIGFEVRVHFQ
jgi:iron complex outermembrane receptor protein